MFTKQLCNSNIHRDGPLPIGSVQEFMLHCIQGFPILR